MAMVAAAIEPFDVDYEHEKILAWAMVNKGLRVWWADMFVDSRDVIVDEEHAHWSFKWKYEHIRFEGLKKEEEDKAKKATALFIYLWCKGVSAGISKTYAASYVITYKAYKITKVQHEQPAICQHPAERTAR